MGEIMIKKPYIDTENEALKRKIEAATWMLGIFAFVCFVIAVIFEAMR